MIGKRPNLVRTSSEMSGSQDSLLNVLEVELIFGSFGQYQHEFIRDIKGSALHTTPDGLLMLAPILKYIKSLQFNINGAMISYLSPLRDIYTYVGNDPLSGDATMPLPEVLNNKITLRCRWRSGHDASLDSSTNSLYDDDSRDSAGACKRTKERKIGFIIEKVARWRNLYNGVQNSRGETIRLTLEEAATQVGISKKSLDDYLLQLRFGRKYGFNFQEHRNDKVGMLRTYVKKYKKMQSDIEKLKSSESLSSELKESISQTGTTQCRDPKKCCIPSADAFKLPSHISQQEIRKLLAIPNPLL